ncbi:hypothetical protein KY328_00015 [Candidatus Woesearchaeota archaeon]|nr:hypothetical protein [Candidatus Woesearchaeota archaeon]MBW3021283.1 hypothetical protein [Candidatus Woesearchaeota archaeon]
MELEHFPTIQRLHQDVLEERYGPVKAKVLRHDDRMRESHLVDGQDVSRTYALTFFPKCLDSELRKIDKEIQAGGTIGRTFRRHGYGIRKNVIDVYIMSLPQWLMADFQHSTPFAKCRWSEFLAKNPDSDPKIYGSVLEVYSPDFRPPILNAYDISQINPISERLAAESVSLSELWRRIGDNNNWSDLENPLLEARISSLGTVFDLRKRASDYIQNKQNK